MNTPLGAGTRKLRAPNDRDAIDELLGEVTITCPEDVRAAAAALARVAEERGMQVAVCDDISSKEPMVDAQGAILNAEIFRWRDERVHWWEDSRLSLHSPLPRACRYESEPFWVNARGFHTGWRNRYLEEIDLTDFEKRALCKAAIVVPIHLPFARIAASSFVSVDRTKEDLSEEFAEHGTLLSLLVRRFVAGYVQAMRTKRRIPSDCVLSKREIECLRWAAIGKTDKEISMILGRSHATIRYHIHRAGDKLDSVNRAQTIFKAGQLGYLGASD